MKKYQLLPILLLLTAFTPLLSCGSDAIQNGSSENNDQTDQMQHSRSTDGGMKTDAVPLDKSAATGSQALPMNNEMQAKAFTGLLQGKWVNEGGPGQSIQFKGNKVKFMTNGQLVEEADFSIDPSCESSHCLVKGEKPIGWCLIETPASGEKCKVVTRIDQKFLVIMDVTNGGVKVQYKRNENPDRKSVV